MISFLNNMIYLETRQLKYLDISDTDFWGKQSSFLRFTLKWFRSSLHTTAVLPSVSEVVFQNVPWKVVPTSLNTLLKSLVCSHSLRQLLRSTITLIYSMKILANLVMINWLLSLLTGTYLLYSSIILFGRKVEKMLETSPSLETPIPIVHFYREIQLLH